jgi:hypothetical protein
MYGVNYNGTGAEYIAENPTLISGLGDNNAMFMLFNPSTSSHYLMWQLQTGINIDVQFDVDPPTTYSGTGSVIFASGFSQWGSAVYVTASGVVDPDEWRHYA